MPWLVLGLALWWGAHLFKRLARGPRAALQSRIGDASKGIFAALLVVAVVLMVIGYRGAETGQVWFPPDWTRHVNNLLMYPAIVLFGLGSSRSRLRGRLRHPQLSGFILWAFAHLLVNGSVAGMVLFGGLLVWALVEIAVINAQDRRPEPFTGGTLAGDIRLALIAAALYAIIVVLHGWLGPWPLPS